MRCAVLSVTAAGYALAKRVKDILPGDAVIFAKEGTGEPETPTFSRLATRVAEIFDRYDALVFVMATGIVCRVIAPHIVSKLSDPAVLVLDEGGRFVISLLSGHIGGANALTRRLSCGLGATAVITTATDVHDCLAPDVVAYDLGLRPYPKEHIKNLNSACLAGQEIRYLVDSELTEATFYLEKLRERGLTAQSVSVADMRGRVSQAAQDGCVAVITAEELALPDNALALAPRPLIAGVGCRRGASREQILAALTAALDKIGRRMTTLTAVASADIKANEPGLLAAVRELGLPVKFFSSEELNRQIREYDLMESALVKQIVGAGNVAEAAALAYAGRGKFALTKTKFPAVTVALVWQI